LELREDSFAEEDMALQLDKTEWEMW